MKDVWLEMNKSMTHLNQVLNNVDNPDDAMKELQPDINKITASFNQLYKYTDQTFGYTQPTIELVSPLLVMCLCLPIILFVAYQAKQLIKPDRQFETVRRRSSAIGTATLQSIYWLCIILALIFMFFVLALFFNHMVDVSEFIWVTQKPHLVNILSSVDFDTIVRVLILFPLYLLALVFVLRLHWKQFLKWAKILAWFCLYASVILPAKLLLNPPYRAWLYCHTTSSCCKGSVSTAFYATFYTALVATHGYLTWTTSSDSNAHLIRILLVPFYTATVVAYVTGTVFNWMIMNIEGFLFTVRDDHDSHDEVDSHEISTRQNRIYYTIQYYQ